MTLTAIDYEPVKPPFLKIVTRDGTTATTTVYLVDKDGTETVVDVPVRRVVMTADSDDWVNAEVTFEGVQVEMTGKVDVAKTREVVDAEYARTIAILDSLAEAEQ